MNLTGSCHCGNLRYVLHWPGEPTAIPGRACTCSFCTRHGAVWTAHPGAELTMRTTDPGAVSSYTFETKTAEFRVCARCGVVPLCISRIDDRDYAVVNLNTLDDPAAVGVQRTPVSFDGEDVPGRLQRRKERWIAAIQSSNPTARPGALR